MTQPGVPAKPASSSGCALWAAIAVGILIALGMLLGNDSDGSSSSRGQCERLMEENRDTAIRSDDNPYGVSEETYIANCMRTNRDLEDGQLDGR